MCGGVSRIIRTQRQSLAAGRCTAINWCWLWDGGSEKYESREWGCHWVKLAGMFLQSHYTVKFDSGDEDEGELTMLRSLTVSWVPERTQEESEGETQPQGGRMFSRGSQRRRVGISHPILSDGRALISWPSSHSSGVWAFFWHMCSRTHCWYLQSLPRAHQAWTNKTNHLGTTSLARHLILYHAARWQQHLKATLHKKSHSAVLPSSTQSSHTISTFSWINGNVDMSLFFIKVSFATVGIYTPYRGDTS